jgi:hypothetical protein
MDNATSSIAIQFWVSYYAQILATLTVVVIGFILANIKTVFNRPKLIFFGTNAKEAKIVLGRNRFTLGRTQEGNWDTSLLLSIRNMGNKTIERFTWEIYADHSISVDFVAREPFPNNYSFGKTEKLNSNCYHGFINTPVFSAEDFIFPFELKVRSKEKKEIRLNYRFMTDGWSMPWYSLFALTFNKRKWLKTLILE